jgi:hypothetical protein
MAAFTATTTERNTAVRKDEADANHANEEPEQPPADAVADVDEGRHGARHVDVDGPSAGLDGREYVFAERMDQVGGRFVLRPRVREDGED